MKTAVITQPWAGNGSGDAPGTRDGQTQSDDGQVKWLRSCLMENAVTAAPPSAKITNTTDRPKDPSHSVVERSGTMASISAIETEILQTVFSVRTKTVHQAPIPRAGM